MNKLVEEIVKPFLKEDTKITKIVGIYGGRFQPFGPHHKKVYQWLSKQFDDAYITTSNIKQLPRHPMNFKEKVRHMSKMGIPSSKIIMEKSPFVAKNLARKFNPDTTAFVYIFGKKDTGRLGGGKYFQDFKKNRKNLKGFEEHGYYLVAPHMSVSAGGLEVSGTSMRQLLGSDKYDDNERAKLFKKMFGYFNQGVFNMMRNKFKKLFESDIEIVPWDNTKPKPVNPKLFDKKDQDLLLDISWRSKLKKIFKSIKKEIDENKKLGKLIKKYFIQAGKLSTRDLKFAKEQFADLLKLAGLTGLAIIPFAKFSIPLLVKVSKKVGVELLPSSFREDVNEGLPTKVSSKYKKLKVGLKSDAEKDFYLHHAGDEIGTASERDTYDWDDDFNEKGGVQDDEKDDKVKGWEPVTEDWFKKGSKKDRALKLKISKLYSKAFKMVANSKEQLKVRKEIEKLRNQLSEDVNIDLDVGDTVLMGKFKNKKVVVKDISWNEKGDMLINGKTATKWRMFKKGPKIPKTPFGEQVEKFLTTIDISKIIKEVSTGGGIGNDDGPNAFMGGKKGYGSRNKKAATKLGWEVIDYILKVDVDDVPPFSHELNDMGWPMGAHNSVSYYPAGIGTGQTANNQSNFTGTKAYNKWKKSMKSVATEVGMELMKFRKQDKDSLKQVSKDSKATLKQQKKDEKEQSKELKDVKVEENTFSKEWWNKELVENIVTKKQLKPRGKELLLMGGAYGHMAHPFDDKDLTFGDLKKIITLGLGGQLNREDNVTEKLDGQNIMVSWKDGKLIAARNKGHLKNSGATALDAKGIASKFKGRGAIRNAFVYAMRDLERAIGSLSEKQKTKIFNNGSNWMNMEIMYPSSANVIDYDVAHLVFHGALKYDKNGTPIGEVRGSGRMLAGMIQQVNQHIQKKFSIGKPVFLTIPKHQDFGKLKTQFLSSLNRYQKRFGLSDNDTLGLYHQKWWEQFITKKSKGKISSSILKGLVKRWAFFDKSYSIGKIKSDIKDEKFLKWVLDFDKKNHAKQVKQNMKPFEILFFRVGAEIMKNMSGFMAANPNRAVQGIRKRLNAAISNVRKGGDLKKLNTLKLQLDKLNSIGGMNSIVPTEGIVFKYKGKTYKFTGAFAPINQITGLISF